MNPIGGNLRSLKPEAFEELERVDCELLDFIGGNVEVEQHRLILEDVHTGST